MNNTVWLVRSDDNDVLVFVNKPKRIKQDNSTYNPRPWADSVLPSEDENYFCMTSFCAAGFRKGTGLRVPKRPVQARVTLLAGKK